MKIAIIGYSGAGKSTLASRLGKLLRCPVLHLDSVNFEAGWKERDETEAKTIIRAFMQNASWIIDGNYNRFYLEERLAQADYIVFMNYPRLICFFRAYKRYRAFFGKTRADMAKGCTEKFDAEFIRWLLWDGRTAHRKKHFQSICRLYADKVILCRNDRETQQFIDRFQ